MAMQEVKAPEQFKFAKQGARLVGILVSIDQKTVGGKPTMEYTFDLLNKDRITCLGTADLDKKIQAKHLGHRMDILYETDDASFQKAGQNAMKVFKVLYEPQAELGYEHLHAA